MRSLRHSLSLFTAIVVAIPLTPIAALIVWGTFVPVYSAGVTLTDMPVILALRFYYTWDENIDSGRYRQVTTPKATIRMAMTAFDWAHNGRASLYLTPRREIAVLGPMDDDYLTSLDPLKSQSITGTAADGWIYLGAFDYESLPGRERRLRFVSAAEQAECIPMRSDEDWTLRVRSSARRPDCR
ncbi:MAG: hypothetical protein J0J01_13260 [Reyranella sp.]|uniref:hypothetical protein n=1 Tax=Reyranella sp. TaxID=1929291 RepID=UPI001ACF8D70|nr:hypothetical protein [Reyranella sp.]MBN9087873.1 hypothetical protein [Reyranella sp.]